MLFRGSTRKTLTSKNRDSEAAISPDNQWVFYTRAARRIVTGESRLARGSHAPLGVSSGAFLFAAVLMTSLYFSASSFGLALLAHPNGVAVFWPASGVAVGALLVFGRQYSAPIALGVFIATIAANVAAGRPVALTPLFGLANAVECLLTVGLAERFLGTNLRFDTLRRVVGIFLAAMVGAAVGAVIGALTIKFLGRADGPLIMHWNLWFRSDFIGILALTPLILGLHMLMRPIPLRDHVEGLILLGLVSLSAAVIYPSMLTEHGIEVSLPISVLFPPLLLLAIRHPLTYSPIGASLVAFITVASVVAQNAVVTEADILWTQATIVSMIVCSLSLSVLIDERRTGEARQRLLVRELDHRVKNGLTLVQAVVERSRETAPAIEDFYPALEGRIRSMARTHSMLSRERWQGLGLAELIETELEPFQDKAPDTLSGPAVMLGPTLAQSLSLVLHELSTNAVKHGALSRPEGRVFVGWQVETSARDSDGKELVIEWREEGVPIRREIGPEGFGTSTIRDLLEYEAGARVTLVFPHYGARCTIRLPIPAPEIEIL